jgi:CBS-domain-containing membrane protein
MADVAAALRFLRGAIRDPFSEDASSARLLAIAFGIVGMIVSLTHPENGGIVVAALIGGGAVALLSRAKGP